VKRKFATNLLLLLLLNLLIKPFWIFGIDRTVQNIVGVGEYGLFYSLFNFTILFNIVLDFGLTNFNNREISRHSQLISKYFSNIVVIKFLLAFFYFFVCLGIALTMGYSGRQLYILFLLVINQFLSSFILYFRSNLSGLQYFKTDSLLSVLDRTLMIILCSVLIWGNFSGFQFSIEWFVYAQTLAYLITFIIAFTLVIIKTEYFKLRIDKVFVISILRQSLPYALLVLLMNFYSRVDSVILERMLPGGNVESGIYAQAFRIVDAVNMIPFLFAGLLLPMFSKMIKDKETIQPFLGFAFTLLFIPSLAFTVSCIAYRSELMEILYRHHAAESSTILGILMISFLLISITYIFGTLLTANGNIRRLNEISLVGVIISLGINLLLIPIYKSLGAAIANMATQFVVVVIQIIAVLKIFRFKINLRSYRNYLFFVPSSILLTVVLKLFISEWILGFVISLVGVLLLGFLFKLIRIKELISLFFRETD